MNSKLESFLLYLLVIAIAIVEVLMKFPIWASKGYTPILFPWVFKAPLLILSIALYIKYRFGK